MKDILKELVRLVVMTIIVMVAFFGFIAIVALMRSGLDYLPQYIGGFSTFMLYLSIFTLIFCMLYNYKNKTK